MGRVQRNKTRSKKTNQGGNQTKDDEGVNNGCDHRDGRVRLVLETFQS